MFTWTEVSSRAKMATDLQPSFLRFLQEFFGSLFVPHFTTMLSSFVHGGSGLFVQFFSPETDSAAEKHAI